MRKNLYLGLIACAALTMTGCSNDEISYDSSKQEAQAIQFDTYLGKNVQGRGTVSTSTTIQSDNIGITAFYTGQAAWSTYKTDKVPNFMCDQKVTYSSAWTYDPVKYWPTTQGDKISFFAYAPYSENDNVTTSTQSATGTPTVTVNYPTNLTQMVDFVAASVIDQEKVGTVSFDLKHEMTRVDIKAKVSDVVYKDDGSHDKTQVVIKSITLNAVGTDGNFYNGGTYTFSDVSSQVGKWAGTRTDPALDLANILATTPQSLGGYTDDGVALEGTTAIPLFQTNQYLFLVPATNQDGAGLTAEKATATIEYDIVTIDANLAAGHSVTSATKTIYLPAGTLKQGIAYTFTFTINVATVDVTATISDDWATTDTGSGIVDYNSNDN